MHGRGRGLVPLHPSPGSKFHQMRGNLLIMCSELGTRLDMQVHVGRAQNGPTQWTLVGGGGGG